MNEGVWIVVQPATGSQCDLEPGAYMSIQRYPDGDVRVRRQDGRDVIVPAGDWTECEE